MKKYTLLLIGSLVAIFAMSLLADSISTKEEQRKTLNQAPVMAEPNHALSSEWQKYYPRQHDSWKQTKNSSKLEDMIVKWPQLAIVWAGYPFAKDYNAPRGHYYAIQDNVNTLRTGSPTGPKDGPLPTACWTCKSPDVVRLIEKDGELEYFTGKWAKYGSEILNSVGCMDCHDPKTAQLAMKRDYLNRGLVAANLPDFNSSTHQVKRDLVCAQCHSEYHFAPVKWGENNSKTAMTVKFPWDNGLGFADMEKYYNNGTNFASGEPFFDYVNSISKTKVIKAQHPDYELHTKGIHAKKGVSCADCHMPYKQEGAVKFSDHKVGNPLDNMDRSCMTCHRDSESNLRSIVKEKYDRKELLFAIAVDNLAKAHLEAGKAWEVGATPEQMKPILEDIRAGQWRWDFAVASHGSFFHAPDETLLALATANEYAQNARIKLVAVLAQNGVLGYAAPDFSTKSKAQGLIPGLDMAKEIEAKCNFKKTLEKEWNKEANMNGRLDNKARDYEDNISSWFTGECK